MIPRLGLNIDHVATLREARGEIYPRVVEAARVCLENGADQITIHLREDRRHIQDTDVEAVRLMTRKFDSLLNLEMGCSSEIIDIAIATKPDWVCLVPENREEQTTEGGLDLLDDENFRKLDKTILKLKSNINDIKISLFMEANITQLEKIQKLSTKIDAVEIHTGEYAKDFNAANEYSQHIEDYKLAKEFLDKNKINCHAGHGLTDKSTEVLLNENIFEEFNIGHWIISNALFNGLGHEVKTLKNKFKE